MRAKERKLVRSYSMLVVTLPIAFVLLISGCSGNGSIGPVSGKVTLDGKPLAGVEVLFVPLPQEGNSNPGPWSNAITDADGNYQIKTRYGKSGAVIGLHDVTFEYIGGGSEEKGDLEADLKEAESKQEAAEISAALAELKKKLKDRPRIPKSAARQLAVPSGGIEPCDFELLVSE